MRRHVASLGDPTRHGSSHRWGRPRPPTEAWRLGRCLPNCPDLDWAAYGAGRPGPTRQGPTAPPATKPCKSSDRGVDGLRGHWSGVVEGEQMVARWDEQDVAGCGQAVVRVPLVLRVVEPVAEIASPRGNAGLGLEGVDVAAERDDVGKAVYHDRRRAEWAAGVERPSGPPGRQVDAVEVAV